MSHLRTDTCLEPCETGGQACKNDVLCVQKKEKKESRATSCWMDDGWMSDVSSVFCVRRDETEGNKTVFNIKLEETVDLPSTLES